MRPPTSHDSQATPRVQPACMRKATQNTSTYCTNDCAQRIPVPAADRWGTAFATLPRDIRGASVFEYMRSYLHFTNGGDFRTAYNFLGAECCRRCWLAFTGVPAASVVQKAQPVKDGAPTRQPAARAYTSEPRSRRIRHKKWPFAAHGRFTGESTMCDE